KTTTFTVLNVNAAPQFVDLGEWREAEGQVVTFRAFAFDPNNPTYHAPDRGENGSVVDPDAQTKTVTYTVSGLPAGATFDDQTTTFRWATGYASAGRYVVSFTATNAGDGTGVPATSTVHVPITILNSNRAPQIPFLTNRSLDPGTVLQLPVTATDPDGDPL